MAGYNLEKDAAKLLAYLDFSREITLSSGKKYTKWRGVTALGLRDEWRWTLSRVQATITHLLDAGLIKEVGFQMDLSDFRKNRRLYEKAR